MAVQNGKTGVPTGSRSDNHTFLVQGQQNLYIIEFKQVCTRRSIASVYEKQYAQSSRTYLWLLLAYKRKFFGQITASDTPLLRIEVISPITNVLGKSQWNIFIS